MNNKRIEWVDIYKAIGIVLVVVGHATGRFNSYIYQFHMAAFFFISGYTSNLKKENLAHYVFKKIYGLYLPLLSITIIGAIIMALLNKTSLFPIFYDENMMYIGVRNIIKNFLIAGDNYVYWLGATWFILVLFKVEVVQKIVYDLCKKQIGLIYAAVGITLFVEGYFCVRGGLLRRGMWDLVLIGQGYFVTGQIIKRFDIIDKITKKGTRLLGIILPCIGYLYFVATRWNVTVDYPSRKFGNIVINYVSGITGSIALCLISYLLSKVLKGYAKKLLIIVGRNTIGILMFHFAAFKILFLVFAKLKVVSMTDVQLTTPSATLEKYWLLISFLAILISLFLWGLLQINPFVKRLFGEKKFWETLWENCKDNLSEYIHIKDFECFNLIRNSKRVVVIPLSICGIIWAYMLFSFITVTQPFTIVFPYDNTQKVTFEKGWLPQGDENYRWINKEGTILVKKGDWDNINISGYIPENFDEVTRVSVLVNDVTMYEKNIDNEQNWECSIMLSGNEKIGSEMEVKILFNGVHEPEKDSVDRRELSGLINKIEFK